MGSPFPFSDEEMMAQIAAARTPQEKERVRQLLGEYGDWLEVNDAQQEWRPTVLLTDEQFDELYAALDDPDPAPNLERAARRSRSVRRR